MTVEVPVYPFVAVDVPRALAEVAAEQLFELGARGVEQRDTTTLIRGSQSAGAVADPGADVGAPVADWDAVRAREAESDEIVTLVAAFETHQEALEAIAAFDDELRPRLQPVVGDAWRDAWKEHFSPFQLSPRIVIEPPWKKADDALRSIAGVHVLELEPGRAFGTGLHATTSLVAKAIDARSRELEGARVLDVGCGSGILAICAIALGARETLCLDVDPEAVRVTEENAQRTGMTARVTAATTEVGAIEGTWPVVLANIQAEVLVPLAPSIVARVAAGGLLILSGILENQADRVLAAYPSLTLEERAQEGEWVALIMRR
ncbi:MAG: 50S ribosomal protein L11 methyltransferase [Polyangiales bacterium]